MTAVTARTLGRFKQNRLGVWSAAAVLVIVGVSAGLIGTYRYLDDYWLYRGYPAPHDPSYVASKGTLEHISVRSAALGGRAQPVDVYLPPGYASHPKERYPVFYLLHGVPGRIGAFFQTVRLGVLEDVLVAKHLAQPIILVAPFGSTGTFTDKEWADGVRAGEGWATFVSRDVVRAIDHRFRTIPTGTGRALGGLSEGGYGALNIGLAHPGEFRVLESWSGYELADDIAAVFGGRAKLLRANSPMSTLRRVARSLRADRTFVWFYSGTDDRFLAQNRLFAAELAGLGIDHHFSVKSGGHDWRLWRGQAVLALLAASRHLPQPQHA